MPTISPNRKYSVAEAGVRLKHGELVPGAKGFSKSHVYTLMALDGLRSMMIRHRRYITEDAICRFERRMAENNTYGVRR